MTLSRRRTLQLGLGAFAGAGCAGVSKLSGQASDALPRDFPVRGQMQLKQRAAAKGLLYGAAGSYQTLSQNPEYAKLFAQSCGILVPENELKWYGLRPSPDGFDFTQSDWLAQFTRQNGMLFRGHTLAWNQSNPEWLKEVTPRDAEKVLIKHISTVGKHYAGRIHSWDVVNEAIAGVPSPRADGLQTSPWLALLDKNYIDIAFHAAAAADPKAMLVYNDAFVEYDTPEDNRTRALTLKMLESLKSRKVPVHALGIQGHLRAAETRFNANKLRQFLRDVASMGLKILITELDASDKGLPADISLRDRAVAHAYEQFLSVVLDEPAVIAVLTWGLSDRYTWLSDFSPRSDRQPVRVLPYSENFRPKLAWNAIARAFDSAPKRG